MNLCGHCTCRKAGAKAWSPLAPVLAPAAGAGSAMSAMRAKRGVGGERVDGRRSSGTPLPGTPNIGYRVPAKPLRFKHWGAHKDFPLPKHALSLAAISKLARRTRNTRDTRFILVRDTVVGSRVPAKPSRFEHWGAHKDFPLPIHVLVLLRSCGRTRRTHNTKDTRFILVWATVVV